MIDPLAKSTDLAGFIWCFGRRNPAKKGVIRRRWAEGERRSVKLEAAF
jgi:hypothetical protein